MTMPKAVSAKRTLLERKESTANFAISLKSMVLVALSSVCSKERMRSKAL